MNTATEESLTDWVAHQLGDLHSANADRYSVCIQAKWSKFFIPYTARQYLSCMNVARRFRDHVLDLQEDLEFSDPMVDAINDAEEFFDKTVWRDTPAAIEVIAKACGWEPPKEG